MRNRESFRHSSSSGDDDDFDSSDLPWIAEYGNPQFRHLSLLLTTNEEYLDK